MASDDCLTLMRSLAWPVTRCARVAPVRATCRRRAARQTPCGTGPHYGRCRSYGIRRGVRVDLQILLRQLVAILSAPNRSVAQEETLQAGEAVDFRSIGKRGFDGFRGTILAAAGRFIESERIGLESDVHTAQIADVLADGQRAVHMRGLRRVIRILFGELRRHELVVLVDELLGERLEIGLVLFGPPVVEFAVAVVLRALVVETVADLMADHRADAAVVRGILGIRVEERRLQMAAGNTITFMDGS